MTTISESRTLTPTQAKARGILYHSGIPYQTGRVKDYQRAVELIRGESWPSLKDEAEALQECSHWVGR